MAKTKRGKSISQFWKNARSSDSKFEEKFMEMYNLPKSSLKLEYVSHHTYTPDFELESGPHKIRVLELKGRFRTSAEARKYKDITQYPQASVEVLFVFQNPNLPMPHAKKRKDGTKQTHAEWAERNGFRWYTLETVGKIL